MICVCQLKIVDFNHRLDRLLHNLHFDLHVPKLLPKLAAQANAALAAQANADAAAAANAAAAAAASAAAKAALAVAADPAVKAAAQLAAAANLKAALEAQLGIDLTSPNATCMMNGLTQSLRLSGLLKALARLGKAEFANLLHLDELAKKLKAIQDLLGHDLLNPALAGALKAGVGARGSAGATAHAQGSAAARATVHAQAKLDAKIAAVTRANAAASAAFAGDLHSTLGLKAIASGLGAMGPNMSSLEALEALLSLALLGPALQALLALEAIEQTLSVDLMSLHAMERLGDALSALSGNLAGMGSGALRGGAALGGRVGASARVGGSAAVRAGARIGAGGGARAGIRASAAGRVAAHAQMAAMARGLASLSPTLANFGPSPPLLAMFMLLLARLKALGIDLIAFTPCGEVHHH